MVESPTEAPAAPASEAPAPPEAAETTAEVVESKKVTIRDLLEAGVHFGHQTRRWNPQMKPYIYGDRNGIHILNLDHTLVLVREAIEAVRDTVAAGGKVLFVGTKRQAQAPILAESQRAKQFYVNHRWLGGMLTNFRTVKKSIEDYKEKLGILGDEEKSAEHSKKELARLTRVSNKYARSLEGIKEMTRLPDLMFVVDVGREHIAVSEAQRLGIPIVAVVDSNCSPLGIDYVIPGNDDATRAVQLYCSRIADACLEGDRIHQERLRAQPRPEARSEEKATTATGRVVVEITQPPRRGRGAAGGPGGNRRGAGGTASAGRGGEAEPEVAAGAPTAASPGTPAPAEPAEAPAPAPAPEAKPE